MDHRHFKTLSNVYSFRTLQIGDGARGRACNKRKATKTIVDVCTSDLPTAKTAQAFLLEDEQIVGTSDTVGIQWVSTDEQQDVPRSWLVRAAASKSLGCGLSVIDTSAPASRFDNMVPDPWPPLSNMNRDNLWWSHTNELKHCVQGCITNLLHHMRAGDEAKRFQLLSTMDDQSLKTHLGIVDFPSKVRRGNGEKTDLFEKCKWLLRSHFKCQVSKPIVVSEVSTIETFVEIMARCKFPVVVSLTITNSNYNHVICVWNKAIIDFEHRATYPLTINNIEFSCGPSSDFVGVRQGYAVLPPKVMRRACMEKDSFNDWGKNDVTGDLKFLFKQGRYERGQW